MDVPVLKQGPFLIATIQAALNDADLNKLRRSLVEQVGRFRSRGVIVDVTSLDVLDSFAARTLRDIAHMTGFRGAETVIVGIHPDLAFAMVQLGLTLEGVATALDLEEGLAYLHEHTRRPARPTAMSRPLMVRRDSAAPGLGGGRVPGLYPHPGHEAGQGPAPGRRRENPRVKP